MDLNIPQEQIWMVVIGFIIAFVLAFGIGANDVANSFGTSVGSRVLTLRQAIILASIFETLGAVLLGAKVSDTIRKGVISVDLYTNDTMLLMTGSVAALSGSCVWLLAATLLRLPVSATHSIVGATVGFALVNHGTQGIQWKKLGFIIGSWFISPVMAGIVSTGIFFVCKFFILSKKDALEPGLRFLPIFYAITIVVNLFSVFYDGPEMLYFDRIPLWGTFIISFGSGIICAIIVRLVVVPWQRRRIRDSVYSTSTEGLPVEGAPELVGPGARSESSSRRDSIAEEKERLTQTDTVIMPTKDYEATLITSPNITSINEDKELNNKPIKVVLDKSDDVALLGSDYKVDGDLAKNSLTPAELTNAKGKALCASV
ncbi:hypothetical protein LSH36_45g02005 [Paralvinella palmiformis]|uniref:Phosphate transporter n=1 Tax=Paralvinella palmiformis TaxID=53620 RepID=A0AAD9K799_9ANNE|nr:hypothetical protein LSH36_45g02005 [Paralvinella palmiformis]